MGELAGPTFAILIYMVIVCGKLTVNCLNAYGGFMSILATVSAFNNRSQVSQRVRAAYACRVRAVVDGRRAGGKRRFFE